MILLPESNLNLSTNPAPVNVITYHYHRCNDGLIVKSSRIDNRKIRLSGLGICMTPQPDSTLKVDIRWDNYAINPRANLMWAGDIVLHERVELQKVSKISFDQNETPDVHVRESRTNRFSGPTYFTCLENSNFIMQPGSNVELNNLSSFINESNSTVEIHNRAKFVVHSGTTLHLRSGSELYIEGKGKLQVDSGACLCIEEGAVIILKDPANEIHIETDVNPSVNTLVLPYTEKCHQNFVSIPYSGAGHLNCD